jgi:hypothetical protein
MREYCGQRGLIERRLARPTLQPKGLRVPQFRRTLAVLLALADSRQVREDIRRPLPGDKLAEKAARPEASLSQPFHYVARAFVGLCLTV